MNQGADVIFDDRLTREENLALAGEDVYDVHEIFESLEEASDHIAKKHNLPIKEVLSNWEEASKEYYSTLTYLEAQDPERAKKHAITERVADYEEQVNEHAETYDAAYCLFSSGRVALVEFY